MIGIARTSQHAGTANSQGREKPPISCEGTFIVDRNRDPLDVTLTAHHGCIRAVLMSRKRRMCNRFILLDRLKGETVAKGDKYHGSERPSFDGLVQFGSEPDTEVESLIPMAESLRDAINRRLYPTGQTELSIPSIDNLFDDAFRDVMHEQLARKIGALTPVEFAEVYVRINPDQELSTQLEKRRDLVANVLTRQNELARIRETTQVSGKLNLQDLHVSNVITIGLFGADKPQLAAKRYSDNAENRPLQRVLQVRVIDPGCGRVQIVNDTWVGPIWSESQKSPLTEAHSTGILGSRSYTDKTSDLEPTLSLHSPLTFMEDRGELFNPPQIIGFVETLDQQILLDF